MNGGTTEKLHPLTVISICAGLQVPTQAVGTWRERREECAWETDAKVRETMLEAEVEPTAVAAMASATAKKRIIFSASAERAGAKKGNGNKVSVKNFDGGTATLYVEG